MYKKIFITITILATIFTFFSYLLFINDEVVQASTADDLAAVQKKLADIRSKKKSIESTIKDQKNLSNQYLNEINSIKNQIDLLDTEIQEIELVISELELQISITTNEIKLAEEDIYFSEKDIELLQVQTDERMIDIYMSEKSSSNLGYIFSDGNKDIIKHSVYQQSVQEETNELLDTLTQKKLDLAAQQEKLKADKAAIEKDKAVIEQEKLVIENKKTSLDQQKSIYTKKRNESLAYLGSSKNYLDSVTFEEQKALAEQQKLEQELFNSFKSINNGTYITAGTVIGYQGCTGLCTGPHLHFAVKINGSYVNPCSQLPTGTLSNCGTSGGTLKWPMSGSFVLTSPYGMRWGKMHYGIDIANYNSSAPILASHDGWYVRGFAKCDPGYWLCKGGGANYAIVCENKTNCNAGKSTMYYHLK